MNEKDIKNHAVSIYEKILDNDLYNDTNKNYELILEILIEYIDYVVSEYRKEIRSNITGEKLENNAMDYFNIPRISRIINYILNNENMYSSYGKKGYNIITIPNYKKHGKNSSYR